MQLSLNQWRNKWLVALAFVGISVGITTAYFTGSGWLRGQVLGTSTLAIQVEQIMPQTFAKFIPGESQQFVWKVVNSGNVPINLAARFTGTWQKPELVSSMFKIFSLKYQLNGTQPWQPVAKEPIVSGQSWFISPTGQESELLTLAAGSEVTIQGNLMLDQSANNDYQVANFPFTLQVIAKQTTQGAVWPEYE